MDQPLIFNRADPQMTRYGGYYYFTASVPAFDRIELRRAPTLEGLAQAEPRVVWQKHDAGPMSRYIWAPELHRIDRGWYLYFAATGAEPDEKGVFDHRVHALGCDAENPLEGAFRELGQVDTGMESFCLDATTFVCRGQRYFVWAQRDYAIPGNSNLYIARMLSPTRLQLPAVLLSRPEYAWDCRGFLDNEGPAVLIRGGKVYLTYSGSATDERYAVGLLTADEKSDLLSPASWVKSPEPVLRTEPENGIFGPGHNSFTTDAEGNDLIVFHARPYPGFRGTPLSDPNRHTYLRAVTFDGGRFSVTAR
jgi:GH43 family beta-xylosidase